MQSIGFVDFLFIGLVIFVVSTIFWEFPPKSKDRFSKPLELDEDLKAYILSLTSGGSFKEIAKSRRQLFENNLDKEAN